VAAVSAPVQVAFRRSGGLAGVTIGVDTDTDDLPPAHGEVVRSLLAGPDSSPADAPGGPDRFTYELQIDDGRQRRVLRWPETAVPEPVRPLIAELTSRSRPVR
jgi:hypothetical protein